jgi:hypothetical protein
VRISPSDAARACQPLEQTGRMPCASGALPGSGRLAATHLHTLHRGHGRNASRPNHILHVLGEFQGSMTPSFLADARLEQCGGARVRHYEKQFKHQESMSWDMKGAMGKRQDMRITRGTGHEFSFTSAHTHTHTDRLRMSCCKGVIDPYVTTDNAHTHTHTQTNTHTHTCNAYTYTHVHTHTYT